MFAGSSLRSSFSLAGPAVRVVRVAAGTNASKIMTMSMSLTTTTATTDDALNQASTVKSSLQQQQQHQQHFVNGPMSTTKRFSSSVAKSLAGMKGRHFLSIDELRYVIVLVLVIVIVIVYTCVRACVSLLVRVMSYAYSMIMWMLILITYHTSQL